MSVSLFPSFCARFLTAFLGLVVVWMTGCAGDPPPAPPPPPAVLAAKVVRKDVPLAVPAIGTVEAYRTISVYPRVTGQILKIHFREGEDVRQGQPLFTIDPAPFRERLRQAEAKLARSMAQREYNDQEAKRYAFLLEKGAVSKSEADRYRTDAAAYDASVKADRAEVEDARLNLSHCFVNAPFAGRTGTYGVNIGTVVRANETTLTTLNQISPVYVRFSIPEAHLQATRRYLREGSVAVLVGPHKTFTGNETVGRLVFIDNTVDPATGMILMKGEFANRDRGLWPGQFVNVSLRLTTLKEAVVCPVRAVQTGDKGRYVFVVNPDMTAEVRPVVVERTQGEEAVIAEGLKGEETVITDGHLKVRPGGKVEIKDVLGATPGGNAKGPGR
ncbi:MAG TPA: efflux RND transporter periplasmic adaptor subunit [Syntrophales bacterium]|nr:efflux RND transporter periplasmic adaptor subunit [Syntrophales bacterium]HOM06522.1 efflux RND transporter periplasmic adaptor subunit [Syntrophales bacterium]HON99907.1 efflux RND transporter periplasmic adaptor subunit [Syntrophales bacterium]HPC00634.1 efflux RND transporter periplasmic adaptor subunit [Syntrophales bacterium]HPQ06216.1 efflux RND transporter periplasmic adaptor subunit [Syntrophales bacterium]